MLFIATETGTPMSASPSKRFTVVRSSLVRHIVISPLTICLDDNGRRLCIQGSERYYDNLTRLIKDQKAITEQSDSLQQALLRFSNAETWTVLSNSRWIGAAELSSALGTPVRPEHVEYHGMSVLPYVQKALIQEEIALRSFKIIEDTSPLPSGRSWPPIPTAFRNVLYVKYLTKTSVKTAHHPGFQSLTDIHLQCGIMIGEFLR